MSTSSSDDDEPTLIIDQPGLFDDITPIPQDDGPKPPVNIAYIRRLMDYFRAIVAKQEISQRALQLSAAVIEENTANYSAWHFRRFVLFGLFSQKQTENVQVENNNDASPTAATAAATATATATAAIDDLLEELSYLNRIIEDNQKNYQVWYHRQALLREMKNRRAHLPRELLISEREYITQMLLTDDAKNYHVWAHRQWFIEEFFFSSSANDEAENAQEMELKFVDQMLQKDFRNNSAWNHRFFVLKCGGFKTTTRPLDTQRRLDEIQHAFDTYINKAPNNESAWNFVVGLARHENLEQATSQKALNREPFVLLKRLAEQLLERAPINVHAHWALIECLTLEDAELRDLKRAAQIAEKLISLDGIRKRYWSFRQRQIENM